MAEALGHAHLEGVVHRDIKPANILLTSRESYGVERPKITDFGVAKLAEGQTTMTGQMVGASSLHAAGTVYRSRPLTGALTFSFWAWCFTGWRLAGKRFRAKASPRFLTRWFTPSLFPRES